MNNPIDEMRRLLALIEAMIPEHRRTTGLQNGDIVQIASHADFWPGHLFRVTRQLKNGHWTGVHLNDHRAGALEGTISYAISEVHLIGHAIDLQSLSSANVEQRKRADELTRKPPETVRKQERRTKPA